MFEFVPLGSGMGAEGASCALALRLACMISFWDGGCRNGIGTAMPKGVLGLSTALRGLFSYVWALGAPSGFTFSALFALLRAKVEMERVGRDEVAAALGVFSGE
jgi:hypothetical protein